MGYEKSKTERFIPRRQRQAESSRWVVAVLLSLLISPATVVGAQQPPSCDSEQHRQFDFWIGEWEVFGPTGQLAGTNRIEKILGGCVLMENWQGAGGTAGKSFNMYYSLDDTWRQTWVDGSGTRLDLSGSFDGKRMVLSGEMPSAQGEGMVFHEISFTPQEDGSVKQHWRASRDGQKTWRDLFVGTYKKKGS